ncbi:MAG TPA: alpha/beta hydrolase [Anaerolineales bacterium]|nr:alpha/beta hydrolase [Anaerolineales bacterium]HLO27852.1 alpha/beta hydrolase [Anaerolineales bacterium]
MLKKSFQKRRLWLIPVGILIVPVLVIFIVGQFTPVLTAWLFKPLIDSTTFTAPPNFETIQKNVVVKKDILYNDQGTLLDIYYPRDAKPPLPVIMWIHGGGFIGASKEQTQVYGMTLANAGYVVANINYDLAPAHKYPIPVIEANQALNYLRENVSQYGGDIDRLFLGSNSSGSQLASQLAALISNKQFAETMGIQLSVTNEQLRGALLYDGAYDMQTLRATRAPGMSLFFWSYTGVRRFESFDRIDELSTIKHVTPDYPPVFLTVGDADPLASQTLELLEVLKKKDIEVEDVLFTGTNTNLGHDYMMDLDTEPAQQTLKKALDFLTRHRQQ